MSTDHRATAAYEARAVELDIEVQRLRELAGEHEARALELHDAAAWSDGAAHADAISRARLHGEASRLYGELLEVLDRLGRPEVV